MDVIQSTKVRYGSIFEAPLFKAQKQQVIWAAFSNTSSQLGRYGRRKRRISVFGGGHYQGYV
jgi:hypothetical protein